MATQTNVFEGWNVLVTGNHAAETNRYRVDRIMLDQSPSCEVGGCCNSVEGAVKQANAEFNASNADYLNLWDLKTGQIITKRVFA